MQLNSVALKQLSQLSPKTRADLLREVRQRIDRHESRRKLWRYYPDEGPLRRDLYPQHVAFFDAGADQGERAIIAANRTGKSTAAAFELTLHLTGHYPAWWRGRRFSRPISAWAAGEDFNAVRDSMQEILFGKPEAIGTGMIPGDDLLNHAAGRGVPDGIHSASVRHVSGGASSLVLKTYEQGREAFQAAKIDVGWCDEEPPMPIYTEFLTRLMSTVPGEPNGIMMATFTPLKGMSDVVRAFLGPDWKPPVAPSEFGADERPSA